MNNGIETPAPTTERPMLLVVSASPEHSAWLPEDEFERGGVGLAWFQDGKAGDHRLSSGYDVAVSEAVNLQAVADRLAATKPDACVLLDDTALSRLAWVLADLASLPVFALVTTEEQLSNLPRRQKPRPDLFFVTSPDLLPKALEDDRYGSTILATGHPARDLGPSGPSATDARQRLLVAIQRWWRRELAPARPDLSIVIPAYREAGNLPLVCDRLVQAIEQHNVQAEILLVDDASPDDTYAVALAQMWRSPRIRAFTKGLRAAWAFAIRYGLQRARAPIVGDHHGRWLRRGRAHPGDVRKVRDEELRPGDRLALPTSRATTRRCRGCTASGARYSATPRGR